MSNLSPSHFLRVTLPEIHDLSSRALLDLTIHLFFGSPGFGYLSSQLKTHYNLPGARDLLTSVPLHINISWAFSSLGFGLRKFQLLCVLISPGASSPELDGFPPCVLPNDGQYQMTSGLHEFWQVHSPVSVHSVKARAPPSGSNDC
jgi:hypothetical protein